MKKKNKFYFFIPLVSSFLFILLFFTGLYKNPDCKIYDMLLHMKPAVSENENLLLLNIDDLSISKVGMFPWSRHIMADGLILMREFGASYAVFDIEYTEDSPMGVDNNLLQQNIPASFAEAFTTMEESVQGLLRAISAGRVPASDAEVFAGDFIGLAESSKSRLLSEVNAIAKDNDEYLGQSAYFFGNTYFTVNMLPEFDPDVDEGTIQYAMENCTIPGRTESGEPWPRTAAGTRPAILPILSKSQGAGFPVIVIDDDGLRRRIDLLIEYEGKYYLQLAFAPLLDYLQNPEITVTRKSLLLKDAVFPDGTETDIIIPLDEESRFMINWPKKDFDSSFRSMSYYYLVLHNRQETGLMRNLQVMEDAGYLSYYSGNREFMDLYRRAEDIRKEVLRGGDRGRIEEYISLREDFFAETEEFLQSDAEAALSGALEEILAMDTLPEKQRQTYTEIRNQVFTYYSNSRSLFKNLSATRDKLSENLPGSFCIIGWTGTATTDRGVNPFDETYDNVGTHAAVINTILNQDFLDEAPWWGSVLLALIGGFGVFFITRKMEALPSLFSGIGFLFLIFAAGTVLFFTAKSYIGMLQPLLTTGVTFAAMTIIKFIVTSREKSYIRNAFGHYLSGEVINELIDNPEKLQLGGDKKYMTAMFTDVKGFSTISEALDPSELVRLLNHYLTVMSDIILDLKGTIDKYEGDAIISFFGAPVSLEDHAERACLAAIKMKQAEEEFNERFIREKLAPSPLLTRIGINSGEMVVGNMGTERKMDYTIMGNSVNLAARLEGVNKQYGTWLLMSGRTYDNGGSKFFTRRLDRVRVVGIHEPVRLYQLIGEKDGVDNTVKEGVEIFHQALDFFENKEWAMARENFLKAAEIIPGDGPAEKYIARCNEYLNTPPEESWDGVYNLTEK